jgi:poly-beta-1,6-N-acetyl-D-glucosamine synthase
VRIVFWLSLIGIFYAYAGYPFVMWLLACLRPWPWIVAPISPSVSIVLAVHNGASLLPRKIQNLLAIDYPNIREIIIVSDGSTDGTTELLANQQSPLIKTIVLSGHVGKAVAVNAGVAQATADVILFADVRQEIVTGALRQLVSNFADPKVGCAAGELTLRQGDQNASSTGVSTLYWRYEQWIRKCEAAFDSPVGVCGCFYAVRRELAVPQPAGMILDDMFQPLSIIRQGYRSILDPRACVYDTWPETPASEFQRKVRTLAGNFQLFRLAPWTLTVQNRVLFQLVSHKVMRLVVPYLLVLLLVSAVFLSAESRLYAAIAALQILGWSFAIVSLRYQIPALRCVAAPITTLLVLNAAAIAGLYKFLFARGPLWKIWNASKPESIKPNLPMNDLVPPKPPAIVPIVHISKSVSIGSQPRGEH